MGAHRAAVTGLDPVVAPEGDLAYGVAQRAPQVDQADLALFEHGGLERLHQRIALLRKPGEVLGRLGGDRRPPEGPDGADRHRRLYDHLAPVVGQLGAPGLAGGGPGDHRCGDRRHAGAGQFGQVALVAVPGQDA